MISPTYDKDDQVGSLFSILKYQIELSNQREFERSIKEDDKINVLSESFVTLFNTFNKLNKVMSSNDVCPSYLNVCDQKLDPAKIIKALTEVIPDKFSETLGGLLEKRSCHTNQDPFANDQRFNIFNFVEKRSQILNFERKSRMTFFEKRQNALNIGIPTWNDEMYPSSLSFVWNDYHDKLSQHGYDPFEILCLTPMVFNTTLKDDLENEIIQIASKFVAIEILLSNHNDLDVALLPDQRQIINKYRLSNFNLKYDIYPKLMKTIQYNSQRLTKFPNWIQSEGQKLSSYYNVLLKVHKIKNDTFSVPITNDEKESALKTLDLELQRQNKNWIRMKLHDNDILVDVMQGSWSDGGDYPTGVPLNVIQRELEKVVKIARSCKNYSQTKSKTFLINPQIIRHQRNAEVATETHPIITTSNVETQTNVNLINVSSQTTSEVNTVFTGGTECNVVNSFCEEKTQLEYDPTVDDCIDFRENIDKIKTVLKDPDKTFDVKKLSKGQRRRLERKRQAARKRKFEAMTIENLGITEPIKNDLTDLPSITEAEKEMATINDKVKHLNDTEKTLLARVLSLRNNRI